MAATKISVTFKSHKATDKWRTPPTVVAWLRAWLQRDFALDAFASDDAHLAAEYFTADRPAPIADWGKDFWFANPCYSREAFASQAYAIADNAHRPGVALVRSDLGTSTGNALMQCATGLVVWPERIAFYDRMGPVRGSNFSNVLLLFGDRAAFPRDVPTAQSQRARQPDPIQPTVLWKP